MRVLECESSPGVLPGDCPLPLRPLLKIRVGSQEENTVHPVPCGSGGWSVVPYTKWWRVLFLVRTHIQVSLPHRSFSPISMFCCVCFFFLSPFLIPSLPSFFPLSLFNKNLRKLHETTNYLKKREREKKKVYRREK